MQPLHSLQRGLPLPPGEGRGEGLRWPFPAVALFVDRQHDGMARRVHVEADNILDLLGEGGVVRALEGADAVRLQAMRLPNALHRAQTDADRLRHRPAGPVGGLAGRLRAGERQNLRHGRQRQRRLAGRTCLVAQQAVHALFSIPQLPAPDCRPAHARRARHLGNRQPIRRKNNNPSPLDVLVRAVAIADDSRQARPILGSNDHANILCHVSKIAWPATPVNPSFVSQH